MYCHAQARIEGLEEDLVGATAAGERAAAAAREEADAARADAAAARAEAEAALARAAPPALPPAVAGMHFEEWESVEAVVGEQEVRWERALDTLRSCGYTILEFIGRGAWGVVVSCATGLRFLTL